MPLGIDTSAAELFVSAAGTMGALSSDGAASAGAPANTVAPMGGYKKSGNGREMGVFGMEEYLEIKAIIGFH